MSGEVEVAFWHRALPTKVLGWILVIIVVAGIADLYLMPTFQALLWAVGHHSTATYPGISVNLPWMWRQEDTPAGQRTLRLVRARLGEPVEFESISIVESTGTASASQSLAHRLQVLAERLGVKDFDRAPLDLDPRFSCMAPHLNEFPDLQIACASTDNHWSATLYGPVPDVDAFRTVLQSLTFIPLQPSAP